MPGVVLDDQSFQLDAMPPSSLYDTFSSHISQVDEVQQMFRENSFSGMNDTSTMGGLSRSAPVYNRSQSALSSAAALQAFNYFNSPPTTPKKSNEHTFSPMSMLDVGMDDFPNMEGDGHGSLGSPSAVMANAMAMAISAGNPVATDSRNHLAFGNSAIVGSPTLADSVTAYKFLPSNNDDEEAWGSVTDVYACDQFRMFEFKVRRCMRGRSHDWTECPFAHPGEKARRRDPRRFHYSGTACPDFRKGSCRRGDACEFAHGVFECWLHPARYRTQPCKDGRNCRRRVCFFAHTPEQLRLLPAAAQAASAAARTNGLNGGGQGSAFSPGTMGGSYDGSPGRNGSVSFDGSLGYDGSGGGGCVSHCSLVSHGSCQSNGGVHGGVCGGHFDQAFGGGNAGGPHAAHCCASPQMSSPTSTLVGHTSSPPPLSPPLSPSGSPPMSPQAHHWANSGGGMLHQNGHSFSPGPPVSNSHSHSQGGFNPASFQVSQPQGGAGGYIQGPCSPLARGANNQAAMSAAVAAAAQAHSNPHRRHSERLNSMPTLSIPPVEHPHRAMLQGVTSPLSSPSSCSPPSPAGVSASNMSEIIATIQQLGLNGNFNGFPPRNNGSVPYWLHTQVQPMQQAANNHYSSGPSPLRRCSQSVPCTPTKLKWEEKSPKWEVEESEEAEQPEQRVESGRDLRAKIYGKLGKEPCSEGSEAPDLDWVSQLITDEQVTTW